ncbi:hypothetical protein ACLOJK_023155 [Asimina triloba]
MVSMQIVSRRWSQRPHVMSSRSSHGSAPLRESYLENLGKAPVAETHTLEPAYRQLQRSQLVSNTIYWGISSNCQLDSVSTIPSDEVGTHRPTPASSRGRCPHLSSSRGRRPHLSRRRACTYQDIRVTPARGAPVKGLG